MNFKFSSIRLVVSNIIGVFIIGVREATSIRILRLHLLMTHWSHYIEASPIEIGYFMHNYQMDITIFICFITVLKIPS